MSHSFGEAWCYLWRECGWLTSGVFGLLAFGILYTAFTPENLTQICVCRKGSKDLIIFEELYYLSFANQVILQTEKKCRIWPSQGCCSMGLTIGQKLKALPSDLSMSREWADGRHFSVCTLQRFKPGRVTRSNAQWFLLAGGCTELNEKKAACLFWQK